MSDYFDNPENFETAGPPRRRARRGLTEHVPVRFRPWTIARVRVLAEKDGKAVSSWIRDVVEAEVDRRLPQHTETRSTGVASAMVLEDALSYSVLKHTTTAHRSEREFALG